MKHKIKIVDLGLYGVKDYLGRSGYGLALLVRDGEKLTVATANFGEHIPVKNAVYLDGSKIPEIEVAIQSQGIATKTAFTKYSGFCECPLYIIDKDFLRQVNPEVYKKYSESWDLLQKIHLTKIPNE